MNTLIQFGWSEIHQQYLNAYPEKALRPGRVISIRGFRYEIITENGLLDTELSGKLMYANSPDDFPKVGDWVTFMDYGSLGYIIDVLPRMNFLARKNPGEKTESQILAANIDVAIVVQGLDRDFNLMRTERYMVQIQWCGIRPLVVLNKADLVDDPESFRTAVLKLGRNVSVHWCSTRTGQGLSELLETVLEPFRTYILIGSSGVGKSSLLNYLAGETAQVINTVSEANSKGKHTTTTRDLFRLKNNSLVIDTPGMREFGLTAGSDSAGESLFPAIDEFAARCKFGDCTHLGEAGCAVMDALASGELDQLVYDSFVKLVKEQRRFQVRIEDKKRLGKQFGKMLREASAYRKKNKY